MSLRNYSVESRRIRNSEQAHTWFGKTIWTVFGVLFLMQLIGGHVQNRFILVGFFGIGLMLKGGRKK